MTFFALKIFLPRLPTLASLVGATFAVLPAVYDACTNVTTGPSASPVTGLPTRTVLSQEKSVSSAGLLIAACFVLSMSSALWLRTPRSQRLHRQDPPPPPPPPPPPQVPAHNADPANDGVEDAEGNGGGDDDDPQEDGARGDGLPDNAAPDMQVADAPAPEDPPPPPPGGIEEDDDEDDDDIMTDSGLPWLILLLIGSALFSLFKAKTLIGAKTVKGVNVDHKAAPVQVAQSTTIPGLLRRQIGFLDVGSKSVSSPATLIAGLLQRRPAAPRPSHRIVYQGDLPQEAAVPLQVIAAAVLRQQGRILPSWARHYALLVLLPFFCRRRRAPELHSPIGRRCL
ncbi:hypothetical protein C8R43DRAFT_263331 [Mycena crocata]|nr:hypothetical protein C8R43DRAFT_263331 [Mycena crocata]